MGRRGFSGPPTSPPEPSRLASHDHEWRLTPRSPVIEDGRAIFTEACNWEEIIGSAHSEKHDETFYETGAQCDEIRSYDMELAWLEKRREGQANIWFLGSEIDSFLPLVEPGLIAVETEGEITACDPGKTYGYVTIETDGWRAKYKANTEPQIDPGRR